MIWHVYRKELTDSLRDKKTIMLSIMLPIIFNIGILYFFDNFLISQEESHVVAINQNADPVVIEWIESEGSATVKKTQDPIKEVTEGNVLVAIQADENLTNSAGVPEIKIYSDPSSTKASSTSEYVLSLLSAHKNKLLAQRLQELNLDQAAITPFEVKAESLSGEDDGSLYMISIFAQLIIVLGVLMGGMPAANDLFAGEKERKTMEALLMTPVKRLDLIIGKWLTIATLGMLSGFFSVVTFVTFVQFFTKNLESALNISDHLTFFTISLVVGIIAVSLLAACLFAILSLMANSIKEAQNYISPVMTIAMIPYFLLIGVSVNELTTTHFLIPFFNVFALIKQLIYGVYDLSSILYVAGSSAVVVAITFGAAYIMFTKSRWVLGKS